jgi:diaminopimelate epimerase
MCGNAIRCFAKYCIEEDLISSDTSEFDVETAAGTKHVTIVDRGSGSIGSDDGGSDAGDGGGRVGGDGSGSDGRGDSGGFSVEVSMGVPDFSAASLGFTGESDADGGLSKRRIDVAGRSIIVSGVNTGTIHIVTWIGEGSSNSITTAASPLDLYGDPEIDRIGSALSSHELFGEKTNVNFARIIGPDEITMTTWERGAGLTAACGTGACAAAVIGMKEAGLSDTVRVYLPYGELIIRRDESGQIYMRGPANRTFKGTI